MQAAVKTQRQKWLAENACTRWAWFKIPYRAPQPIFLIACFPRAIASVITLVVSIGYIRLLPQASAFQASCLCIAFGIYPAVYRIPHRGPTPISLSFASIMRSHLFI